MPGSHLLKRSKLKLESSKHKSKFRLNIRIFLVLISGVLVVLLASTARISHNINTANPATTTTTTTTTNNNNNNHDGNKLHQNFKQENKVKPVTVAYAISLVRCGDHQSTAAGLVDAALVMRHSIHMTSIRNPTSGSKYDYKMYAIVHTEAQECSKTLRDVGFEIVVVDPPVKQEEIRGEHLRNYIHKEWCCGSDEFIKLYAYTLPEPIIVHVDIDFAFMQPMDFLFDAILFDKDSPQGQLARSKIPLERPNDELPDTIGAFVTRDWPQVMPGRKAGFQAGFIVARRDPTIFNELVEVIREGNYSEGFSRQNGWGGAGYGGFVGAMAMQGLVAYYYDMIRLNNAVELNQCRFNHMGMNVLYQHPPNFKKKHPKVGKCRNDLDYCEDCTVTDFELIYNVHYTECRKPWNCIGVGHGGGTTPEGRAAGKRADAIDTNAGNFEHCMELITRWHDIRKDLELKFYNLTKDELILQGTKGIHKTQYFRGHCNGEGGANYSQILASEQAFKRLVNLYQW